MLQLQRASAGSGKTYTLAKKFIQYLIAVKDGGKWRLRKPREITDGLPRILAITFTNKATNEMKQRIVEKLADLARADGSEPLSAAETAKIAYLNDFTKEFNTTTTAVGRTAREALSILLNDYSDFKVSTIDSFFQTILRTFAYESNLNDSYQVEIDSDFLAAAAVDSTIDDIYNNPEQNPRASFWMGEMIKEQADAGSTAWNVFQKNTRDDSIYSRLKKAIMRLEDENFKEIRDRLDDYFNTDDGSDPLIKAFTLCREKIETPMRDALEQAKENASLLRRQFAECGLDVASDGNSRLAGHLEKLGNIRYNQTAKTRPFAPLKIGPKVSILAKGVSHPRLDELTATATALYEGYSTWLEMRESAPWKHWAVYSPLIPLLGLLGEARIKIRNLLENNNSIQLGETNAMLRSIIGDDDAPFVYERIGTRINHYLIDEFQDTSRLQWDNMVALLRESESRGEDNLIIGDAKQSIYRFRNADPSLISTSVPEAFPSHVAKGMDRADNTNWRSDRTVVEFNNHFFHCLVGELLETSQGTIDFADLYGNVVQYASHRERKGYVEVDFLSVPSEDEESSEETTSVSGKASKKESKEEILKRDAMRRIGPLVSSLIKRGYAQRDIAFLVKTNKMGKEVISALIDYNNSLPPAEPKIEFISEESLLISSSEAVGIIVSVFETMVRATDRHGSAERNESGVKAKWTDIRCNFNFYALRHPELSPSMQVKGFLEEDSPEDSINAMLAGMQTVALPALVEAITENFVPRKLRETQAVFIAAFQDLVLDYCDSYAADISSFLEWWQTKGVAVSISSPEGTDAVQVMTIHKSKGLEFKCVIMPYANLSFVPSPMKSEWKWVETAKCLKDCGLPPFLPVSTTSALVGTEHEEVWTRYFDLNMMDNLNSAYVAFTRAVDELYVLTERPGKATSKNIGWALEKIFSNGYCPPLPASASDSDCMLPSSLVAWNEGHDRLTIGTQPDAGKREETEESTASGICLIEEYGVDSSPAILQYVEGDDESDASILPEAEDSDPRSEGSLLHAVMERVDIPSDLHGAITALRMRGLVDRERAKDWEAMLSEAISGSDVAEWFSGKWRVVNERSILMPKKAICRPDRILVSPDRSKAVVVDYKFGAEPEGKAHVRQVGKYMEAVGQALGIKDVEGYVWYVRTGKIVKSFV